MRRNERKLLKAIEGLNAALKRLLEVAEAAISIAAETKALLAQSDALAEQWRQLCEAAQNRPVVVEVVLVPHGEWMN